MILFARRNMIVYLLLLIAICLTVTGEVLLKLGMNVVRIDVGAFNASLAEDQLREAVRLAVRRCATAWTGKKPLVDVTLVKVAA